MNPAHDFTLRLQDLLRREHGAMTEFLVALSEFDGRRLWLDLGYASLFDFLHRELGLSKASASFRKKAAELVQRFPDIVEPLRDGRLCLSSVFELAKVLTPENRAEVLPRFFQLGKREAKAVVAALSPGDVPRREMVTTVRLVTAAPALAARTPGSGTGGRSPSAASSSPASGSPSHPAGNAGSVPEASVSLGVVCPAKPVHANFGAGTQEGPPVASAPAAPHATAPTTVEPLTADLRRLHVTVPRRFLEKLEAARAAHSHSHPGASADEILEVGLDLLLERQAKRKGLVKKPRREPPASRPDHVPAHVKRAVWERDGGRCQWPISSGGICGSTLRVELDHRAAKAHGGPPTVANMWCLCRFHNGLAAREVFGDAWMDRYTRGRRAGAPGAVPQPAPA